MSSIPYLGTNGFGVKPMTVTSTSVASNSSNAFWKYLILSGIVISIIALIVYLFSVFSKKETKEKKSPKTNTTEVNGEVQTYSEIDSQGNMLTWTYPKGKYDTVEDVKKYGKLYKQKRP